MCISRRNRYHVRPIEADSTNACNSAYECLNQIHILQAQQNYKMDDMEHSVVPILHHPYVTISHSLDKAVVEFFGLSCFELTTHCMHKWPFYQPNRLGLFRLRSQFLNTIASKDRTFTRRSCSKLASFVVLNACDGSLFYGEVNPILIANLHTDLYKSLK